MAHRGWVSGLGPDPEEGLDQQSSPDPSVAPFRRPGDPVAGAATNLPDAQQAATQPSTQRSIAAPPVTPSPPRRRRRVWRSAAALFAVALLLIASGVTYMLLNPAGSSTTDDSGGAQASPSTSLRASALPSYTGGPEETEPPLNSQRPAELGKEHVTSADGLYSYDVPKGGDVRMKPSATGEAPEYRTCLQLSGGVVDVQRYALKGSSSSSKLELTTAAVQSVAYIGHVQEPRSVSIDGREAVILIVTDVFGNDGSAIFVFIVLDRSEHSVVRIRGTNASRGPSQEYSHRDFEVVHNSVTAILLSFRIGV